MTSVFLIDDLPASHEYSPEYFDWLFEVWFTQGFNLIY